MTLLGSGPSEGLWIGSWRSTDGKCCRSEGGIMARESPGGDGMGLILEGELKRASDREEEIGGGVHCSWNVSVREYLHSTYKLCPRSWGMGLAGPQQIRPSVLRYRIIQATIEVITMSCLILRRVGGKARVRDADASRRRWPHPSASGKEKKKKKQN
ncbi:hypothetical protein Naga_100026g39 [Nannochloropsis gaditana]|uniref:Uncharacterized protein n=1 Tax=Nannochloropsis gaditana TaxID=72520 RepID=W7U3L9_9STRA|nr:hypothetical protein Naga_100026g39 [Nannochloropsis gaditana]